MQLGQVMTRHKNGKHIWQKIKAEAGPGSDADLETRLSGTISQRLSHEETEAVLWWDKVRTCAVYMLVNPTLW